jgi:hypothetical protein
MKKENKPEESSNQFSALIPSALMNLNPLAFGQLNIKIVALLQGQRNLFSSLPGEGFVAESC